ncbi:hypothetical protein VaNZ11_005631 [Volvox africanus]|uniref:Uncharacterized protein n=1 Tax=Volvox africanus TaxID=51714 RepID=A0ABQ5RZ22_9CHLO|nr:hypothetical protein VaNZ11_005631 [Volvox africanus]
MSFRPDEFDVELAFETELQRIKLEDVSLGQELIQEGDSCCLGSEDGEDDDGEPRSLHLLRTALERRERAAEDFGREWQRFCHAVTSVDISMVASGPEVILHDDLPGVTAESGSTSCSSPHNFVHDAAVERRCKRGQMHGTQDRCCLQSDASSSPLPNDQLRGALVPTLQAVERSQDASGGGLHNGVEAVTDDHQQTRSFMAEQDVSRGVPADTGKRNTEEIEEQRRRTLTELGERVARDVAERQAEVAASAMEQTKLSAEIDVMLRRLELVWKQVAAREARHQAALAALRGEAMQLARQHMAAWRIARAWRCYRQGPVRAMRLAAAVRIQAAWRGHVDRRIALRLCTEKTILQAVEDAVTRGHAERLRSAACHAQEMGLQDVVQARLVEVEAEVTQASEKLRAAAESGTYPEYKSALLMAKRFPCLEQLMSDSTAMFGVRQAEAEASVWAAVKDMPMRSFYQVLESVSPMGIQPGRLAAALEAVRQRDDEVLTGLAAASKAQGRFFSLIEFEALMERAFRLGLKGEAAAAHLVVERRRRSLAQVLRTRASIPPCNAADFLGLLEEARRMGMISEAEDLMQQLQSRQRVLQVTLGENVVKDSAARATILIKHALDLRVQASALQDAKTLLLKRRKAGSEAVVTAASCGSLHEFLTARGAGIHGGVDLAKLLPADLTLISRRRAALSSLGKEVAIRCSEAFLAWTNNSLVLAIGIGAARAVLERSIEDTVSTNAFYGLKPVFAGSKSLRHWATQPEDLFYPINGALQHESPYPLMTAEVKHTCLSPLGLETLPWDSVSRRVDLLMISDIDRRSANGRGCIGIPHASVTEWPTLLSTVRLGLPDAASLALCVLDLHKDVRTAKGASCLLAAITEKDFWGLPLLYTERGEAACVNAAFAGIPSGRSVNAHVDEIITRLASLIMRHKCMVGLRPWWALPEVPVLPAVRRGEASDKSYLSTMLVHRSEHVCESVAPHLSMLSRSSAWKAHDALTESIILRNVPWMASQGTAIGMACLPPLFRLDLGLERLTSLQGLDSLCPSLRSLSADANQLSSLEGLEGLLKLQELSLKQNQLTSLVHLVQTGQAVALPSGTCLKRLMLDSNKLSGQLKGLIKCSGLRSVSLADNALTDLGSDLEPSRAVLTSLSVSSNHLTSLRLQLASLNNLRELDVSGNRLTSLEGIQDLLLLQSLHASGNAISVLPKHLCLPHLTALDLRQNALTAFGNCGHLSIGSYLALPRLKCLVLQENCISLLGTLGPMLHLTKLDLSFNNLASWDALLALVHLSGLRKLLIGNNPMTESVAESSGPGGTGIRAPVFNGYVPGQGLSLFRLVASSNSSMVWALPSLQELDHHGVESQFRLDSVVWAARASPNYAITGTWRLRTFGSCYVVSPAARSVIPTAAFVRQHHHGVPAGDRVQCWSYAYYTGLFGVHPNPVSIGSILITANWPVGHNALCGLHAETTWFGGVGCVRPMQCAVSLHQQLGTECCEVGCSTDIVWPVRATAAMEWLKCVTRLWHATGPAETLDLHIRQLTVSQGFMSKAYAYALPVLQYFREIDVVLSALVLNSLGIQERRRAEFLDFEVLHRVRPSVRFFQYFASSEIWSKGHMPTGSTAAADTKKPAGRANEASILAIGAEAHLRYETSICQTGRQLAGEFRELLEQQSRRCLGNPGPVLRDKPLLTVRPSYFFFRMCKDARTATTYIQRLWRGLRGRKEAHGIRANAQRSAAIAIQAWWRGYCVRRAELPSSSREQVKQTQQDFHHREGAASIIQAHFRGYLVRKRLRIAMAAVLQPSGSLKDFEPMVDSGELDDMLQDFLGPTEKVLLGDDVNRSWALTSSPLQCGASLPYVEQVLSRNYQQDNDLHHGFHIPGHDLATAWVRPQPTLVAPSGSATQFLKGTPSGVPGENKALYKTQKTGLQVLSPVPPVHLGSLLSVNSAAQLGQVDMAIQGWGPSSDLVSAFQQSTGFTTPAIRHMNAVSSAVDSSMLVPACVLPPISFGSSALQTAMQSVPHGTSSCHSRIVCISPHHLPGEDVFSPSSAKWPHHHADSSNESLRREHDLSTVDSSARNREQRHLERLQKLMVEWGFKDLGTAEAYYRRAVRQKQGHARRKFRDKNQDFTQQHLKMPCKLEDLHEDAIVNSRSSSGLQLGSPDMPSTTECCGELVGTRSSLQRNLNSADGVLLGSMGCTSGDMLPQINRIRSQSGGRDLRSADNVSPACRGGHVLATQRGAKAYEMLSKSGMAQRPHHLPTLTSNNWILPANSQSPRRNSTGVRLSWTGNSRRLAKREE